VAQINLQGRYIALGTTLACLLHSWGALPSPDRSSEPALAWVNLLLLVVAVALSIAAQALLAKDPQNPVIDDSQPNLAQRGAIAPRVIGRARLGPIVCWVGDRVTGQESLGGGGKGLGGDAPTQTIYQEAGMHVLCVGPGKALHQIIQNGEVLFDGPITPASHPSGTAIDLGTGEGKFEIYWGEANGPLDTFMGDVNRLGVTSRWPGFMRIVWIAKRLGPSPTWPGLNYVVECEPQESENFLTQTNAYNQGVETLGGNAYPVVDHLNDIEGFGWFEFAGELTTIFEPSTKIQIQNDTGLGAPTDYTIKFVNYLASTDRTRVRPFNGVSGANGDGTADTYTGDNDDGYNPAHIIAELLFAQHPHGLGRSTSNWDLNALETFGTLCETELMRAHIHMKNGRQYNAQLAALMQDFGFLLPYSPETGKVELVPIRS